MCISFNIFNLKRDDISAVAPKCSNVSVGLSSNAIENVSNTITSLTTIGVPICYEKPKNSLGNYMTVLSSTPSNDAHFPVICLNDKLLYLRNFSSDNYQIHMCSDRMSSQPNNCTVVRNNYDECYKNISKSASNQIKFWETKLTAYFVDGFTCGPSNHSTPQTGFIIRGFNDHKWSCIYIDLQSNMRNQTPFVFYSQSLQMAMMFMMKKFYPETYYKVRDFRRNVDCLKGDIYINPVLTENGECSNEIYHIVDPTIENVITGELSKNMDFDIYRSEIISSKNVNKINNGVMTTPPSEVPAMYANPKVYRCGTTCYSPKGFLFKNNSGKWACISPQKEDPNSPYHYMISKFEQIALMSLMEKYYPDQPYIITFKTPSGIRCQNCLIGKARRTN